MLTCAFASAGNAVPSSSCSGSWAALVRGATASVWPRGVLCQPPGCDAQHGHVRYLTGVLGVRTQLGEQLLWVRQHPLSSPLGHAHRNLPSSQLTQEEARPATRWEGELVIQNMRRSGPLVLRPGRLSKGPVKLCPRGTGWGVFSHRLLTLRTSTFRNQPSGATRTQLSVPLCRLPSALSSVPSLPSGRRRLQFQLAKPCAVCLSHPGYEGVSEFFTDLLNHIATVLQDQSAATGDTAPLRHSRLLAEQADSLAGERTCSASPGCCSSMMGQDPPWTTEDDAGGVGAVGAGSTAKLPHQRLGCTAAVSPSFQQHCVASLATKASSQ